MFFRKVVLFLFVLLTLPVLLGAQPVEPPSWTWSQFLTLLVTPGFVPSVIAVLWSIGVTYIEAFEDAAKWIKALIFVGLCMVVPLIGAGLGVLTEGWDPSWQATFWPAILAGGWAFFVGNMVHRFIPIEDLPGTVKRRREV